MRSTAGTAEHGFVLIFVLWVMVGCGLLLASYAKMQANPRVTQHLVADPLEELMFDNLGNYVAHHAKDSRENVDAQWLAQNKIATLQESANQGTLNAAAQLAEMLRQMGFEVNIPSGSSVASIIQQEQALLQSIAAGTMVDHNVDAEFSAGAAARRIKLGGTEYQILAFPVAMKPNINRLPVKALSRYLIYLGIERGAAEHLAAVIAHWRGDLDVPEGISFEDYYRGQSPSYNAPAAAITEWPSFALIKDGSLGLADFLREHFTLWGGSYRVIYDALPPEALAALADISAVDAKTAVELLRKAGKPGAIEDAIGADSAFKFSSVIETRPPEGDPILVEIADGNRKLSFILDPKSGRISERRFLGG